MRMPIVDFLLGADLKFVLLFIALMAFSVVWAIKKVKTKEADRIVQYNLKIKAAASWLPALAMLSLLLGWMHSFYFIGKAGSVAPSMLYNGLANAMVTPVLGLLVFLFIRILSFVGNKSAKI